MTFELPRPFQAPIVVRIAQRNPGDKTDHRMDLAELRSAPGPPLPVQRDSSGNEIYACQRLFCSAKRIRPFPGGCGQRFSEECAYLLKKARLMG